MDKAVLHRHLAEVVAHIALGEGTIARQRQVVAKLESRGLDSGAARSLLAKLEEAQVVHLADRERFRSELAASRSGL
jgi:hypothetical protein